MADNFTHVQNNANNDWIDPNDSIAYGYYGGDFGSKTYADLSAGLLQNDTNINSALSASDGQQAHMDSAASAQQAFQEANQNKVMQFNAQEAMKERDWSEYMSNTSHQREVVDLMLAGLNPVLSAGGNGAAAYSGASAAAQNQAGSKADTDITKSTILASYLNKMIDADTAIQTANINAQTQKDVAQMYTDANIASSKYAADMNLSGTYALAAANRYSSDNAFNASLYGSDKNYASSTYGSDKNYASSVYSTDAANWRAHYLPTTPTQALAGASLDIANGIDGALAKRNYSVGPSAASIKDFGSKVLHKILYGYKK